MNIEEISAAQQALFDAADGESRSLTEEETETYETLEKSLIAAQKTDELRKRHVAWQAPRTSIASPMPRGVEKRDSEEFAFDRYLRGDMGATKELRPAQFAQSTTTTAGGYLVPTTTEARLIEITKQYGGLAPYADHLSTSSGNPVNFPTIDDTANSSVVTAEGSAAGSGGADLVFGQVTLSAYEFAASGTSNAGLIVSNQLLQDSQFDVTSRVVHFMGIRLARGMANAYINGTGSSQPSGALNTSGNANKLAITGGQFVSTAEAIKETVALVFALDPSYWPNAKWLMSTSTLQNYVGLVDGQNRPLLQALAMSGLSGEVGGAGSTVGYQLMGYPVIVDVGVPAYSTTSAANPDPGTNNDIYLAFGDWSRGFVIRDIAGGTSILADIYGKMNVNSVQYFGFSRTDSKIQDRGAFKTQAGFHS